MAWTLIAGEKTIPWKKTRVIGRSDLPAARMLSREHFEISERDGHIYLRDLGSTNGTVYLGKRLQKGEEIPLIVGEEFQAGDVVFRLGECVDEAAPGLYKIDAAIFAFSILVVFLDPSLRFGFSIGFGGVAILLIGCIVAFLPCALSLSWIFFDKLGLEPSKSNKKIYACLVTVLSLSLYHLAMTYADFKWHVADGMITAKIDYFCVQHFNQPQCVRQVNLCPRCAAVIPKSERQKVVERLGAYRPQYPKLPTGPDQRQPASALPKSAH